jgi:hypothetical protein
MPQSWRGISGPAAGGAPMACRLVRPIGWVFDCGGFEACLHRAPIDMRAGRGEQQIKHYAAGRKCGFFCYDKVGSRRGAESKGKRHSALLPPIELLAAC